MRRVGLGVSPSRDSKTARGDRAPYLRSKAVEDCRTPKRKRLPATPRNSEGFEIRKRASRRAALNAKGRARRPAEPRFENGARGPRALPAFQSGRGLPHSKTQATSCYTSEFRRFWRFENGRLTEPH